MRILKLTGVDIRPAVAMVYKNKVSNALYFNIQHGSFGKNFWIYTCGLNKIFFTPKDEQDRITLSDDNYILKPIKRNKEKIKDGKENILYNISIDSMENHKKDCIIFWEVPNKNYTNVTYTISGNAAMIAEGITGKERNDTIYSSPAPIIEAYGNCKLEWSGLNNNGERVSQTINFDYVNDKFDIPPITTTTIKGDDNGN